nr:unnamed protein product [Callosobruchus analis]
MEPGKPRRRHHRASQVNAYIKKTVEWGLVSKVQFNVQETQATLTKKSHVGLPTVKMEGRPIVESPFVKLLRINITNNMSWNDYVVAIAKTAFQKLYTYEQLLLLYKTHIRPWLEYCSHVWDCATKHYLKLLDSIQDRAAGLINAPPEPGASKKGSRPCFTDSIIERSSELWQIITPKSVRTRNTREALRPHLYQVEVSTPRTSKDTEGSAFLLLADFPAAIPLIPPGSSHKVKLYVEEQLADLGNNLDIPSVIRVFIIRETTSEPVLAALINMPPMEPIYTDPTQV